jgi:hypothetical protein
MQHGLVALRVEVARADEQSKSRNGWMHHVVLRRVAAALAVASQRVEPEALVAREGEGGGDRLGLKQLGARGDHIDGIDSLAQRREHPRQPRPGPIHLEQTHDGVVGLRLRHE